MLQDQPLSYPGFVSSLSYTRARGGRRRALADGRTMVAGARFYFFSHLYARARRAPPPRPRFYFFSHLYARARRAPPPRRSVG